MSQPTETGRKAVNGVELYYEVHGEGSPLVMLHSRDELPLTDSAAPSHLSPRGRG